MSPIEPLEPSPKPRFRRPAAVALAAGALTAAVSLAIPNYYKSEARVMIVSDPGKIASRDAWSPAAGLGVARVEDEGTAVAAVDILKSRWLAEKLLAATYTFSARPWRFGDVETRTQTLRDYLKADNLDKGVSGVHRILTVQRDLKSGLLTIGAETISPELSQQIAHNAVDLMQGYMTEFTEGIAKAKSQYTAERLRQAEQEYATANGRLMGFLNGNWNFLDSADPQVRVQGQKLQAEVERLRALRQSLDLTHEQTLIEEKNVIPSIKVLDPGNLPLEKSKPARAFLATLAAVLAGFAAWAFENRSWIQRKFVAKERIA